MKVVGDHMAKVSSLWALLVLTFSIGLIEGCKKTENGDGNLIVFHGAQVDDLKSLDPANAYDELSLEVVGNVYETLFQQTYLTDEFRLVPLLAADFPKYSKDRLTVTIPIRHGIKFQDDTCFKEAKGKGRELKASDFIHAWKRLALPSLRSQGWWVWDSKIKGINEFQKKLASAKRAEMSKVFAEPIEGFEAIDEYTIQIKLNAPYPQLLSILALAFTAPVPPEAVSAYADEDLSIGEHPVGTGPFVLKSWERGKKIVLDRNPEYHPDFFPMEGSPSFRKAGMFADSGKPLPFIDRVVLDVVSDQQPVWLGFIKGEYDLIRVPYQRLPSVILADGKLAPELEGKGIKLHASPGSTFQYLSMNMKDAVLGVNRNLRQAISSAIDRDTWINQFSQGAGTKATEMLPPGLQDRVGNSKLKYDYNPGLAKELLKKAGYPEGKGLPVLNLDLRGADQVSRQLGEFFSKQLTAVGIRINVIYNTFPGYLEKLRRGELQLTVGAWLLDYPDAHNVMQLLYGPNLSPGPNEANFSNTAYNQLFEKFTVLEAGPERAALIKKMDEIVQEECPWALGYYRASVKLSQPWLLNYRDNDLIINKFKYLKINRDVKRRYGESGP